MYTTFNREFLDIVALSFNSNRTEEGFKNESLALAEYTNGEENNIGIFYCLGLNNTNPNLNINDELIFTLIDNPHIWAAKDSKNNDLEAVDRSDIDTDMGLVVAPTVKILNYRDLKGILRMLDRNDLASKEVLTLTDINEIIDFANANKELFGFSNSEARN